MAGRQSKISKHLECPVCLDIYRDPRILPCEAGGHTVCKGCIDDLVKGASLTCPVCRSKHDVPNVGARKFPRNLIVAGLVDSMCPACRSREPEMMCTHCDKMLCETCQSSHETFSCAQSALQELDVTLNQADHEVTDAAIDSLLSEVEKEVDKGIDPLVRKLEERRQTLKMELRGIINGYINSRKPWKQQTKTIIYTAKQYIHDKMRELGDEYSDNITDEKMSEIKTQSQQKITEIKQQLTQSPALRKPVLRFDNRDALAAISSFGCVDDHKDTSGTDRHAAPSTGRPTTSITGRPTTTESGQPAVVRPKILPDKSARPRVIGKEGSGPGTFRQPTDVAVCPVTGRIVVADSGNSRIQVLDASFNHLMDIKRAGQGRDLQYPARVAVNSKGEIIVSDYHIDRVLVYDKSGAYSRDLLRGSWNRPGGIVVDDDDTLYIVNGTGTIKVINKEGQELRTIRKRGQTTINIVSHITIYKNRLIVCDNGHLYQVDKMGSSSSSCTELDYVQPARGARGLAVDNSGDLVIVDCEGPVAAVRDGRVVRHVGEQGQQPWKLSGPRGVAVTKTGEIIIVNHNKGNLLVYAP